MNEMTDSLLLDTMFSEHVDSREALLNNLEMSTKADKEIDELEIAREIDVREIRNSVLLQDDMDEEDRLELERRYGEEQKKQQEQDKDDGMYSSRSFAIGLIGIASCYLVVMICKAYKRMNDPEEDYTNDDSITYYYGTGSYDFSQY